MHTHPGHPHYGQQVGGTHPAGMLSCLQEAIVAIFLLTCVLLTSMYSSMMRTACVSVTTTSKDSIHGLIQACQRIIFNHFKKN